MVSRYPSCEYELMKTIEVKVGQHIKVNVTNDDNPLACLKTEKNSVCYYETLQGIAEGRVLISERNETIFYHPENYTIIFFKNMIADSSIFQNWYDLIIGLNNSFKIQYVKEISGSKETNFVIHNPTFNPNDADKVEISNSKHSNFEPSKKC